MITAPGIGSGLDIESLISQLMELERRPLVALQNKQSSLEAQLSSYGKVKSALSTFESAMSGLSTAAKFRIFTATSADETIYTVTAASDAAIGTHDIEVKNLAFEHRMNSAAFADSDTTTIGNAGDQMTIQVGSDSFTVGIGAKTLEGIRDAINNASDNKGVTATIINEDSGHRLILTSNSAGTANALTLSFKDSGGSPIADPLTMATQTAAEDSVIVVDGFTATRSTNTITDVVQGVTLTLKGESAVGVTTRLTVDRDIAAVKESVQAFVDAYNALRNEITAQRATSLSGDSTLTSIESRLLEVINSPASGLSSGLAHLSELGVSIQKDGTMALNATLLDDQLNKDFDAAVELFTDTTQGFAVRLEDVAEDMLKVNGVVDVREDGINARIDTLEDRQDVMAVRLVRIEDRLRAQFSALDALLGQMQATSNFLAQQLSALS